MSPSYWGPSTWIFMHTLAAKIKETSFPLIGPNVIHILIQICNNLPCPECSQHAREFWSKVKTVNIKTKTDLINLLFVFHNMVNKRKQSRPFKYENLQYYERLRNRQMLETFLFLTCCIDNFLNTVILNYFITSVTRTTISSNALLIYPCYINRSARNILSLLNRINFCMNRAVVLNMFT